MIVPSLLRMALEYGNLTQEFVDSFSSNHVTQRIPVLVVVEEQTLTLECKSLFKRKAWNTIAVCDRA